MECIMNTLCLFGSDYASAGELHLALKELLSLPDYYGLNADALNDCLSELPSCPALWVRTEGPEEVVSALEKVARVFRDNGAEVKEL